MTQNAITHCIAVRKKQGFAESHCLRLAVRTGGCAGMEYDVSFVETKQEKDKSFEFMTESGETLHVVIDPKSYLFINGVEVDYQVTFMDSKFIFNNPNAASACGCGTSFKVS